jgi:hypothetical protein
MCIPALERVLPSFPNENPINIADELPLTEIQAKLLDLSKKDFSVCNLIEIEEELIGLQTSLALLQKNPTYRQASTKEMQKDLSLLQMKLEDTDIKQLLVYQKKAEAAGLGYLIQHQKVLKFVCESGLLYTVIMLKNSKIDLLNDDYGLRLSSDGQSVEFKVNDQYVSFEQLPTDINFDPVTEKFPGWNFVHPMGFIPVDRYDYKQPYPIAQLSKKAVESLQKLARHFYANPSSDILGKDYVFQVVLSDTPRSQTIPWLQNLGTWVPFSLHASIRVITPDGLVYSSGIKQRNEDENFSLTNYFSTRIVKMPMPDFFEARCCNTCRVTSIPISKIESEKILNIINKFNVGIPFCFPIQNCMRVIEAIAKTIDVKIETTVPIQAAFWGSLPEIKDLPFVGPALVFLATKVNKITGPLFKALSAYYEREVPRIVKKVIELSWTALSFALRKSLTVFLNLLSIAVGSTTPLPHESSEIREKQKENVKSLDGIAWFEQLLQWKDIFKDDAIILYHSKLLKEWQERQDSTFVINKQIPQLCILPQEN